MKKNNITNTICLLVAVLLAVCALGGCAGSNVSAVSVPRESEPTKQARKVTAEKPTAVKPDTPITASSYDALNEFSYQLFAENMDEENPVLSPVSAYIALSMAGIGAENNTKEEFASVLGDEAVVRALCEKLMTTLPTETKNTTITLANSAWIDDTFAVKDNWISEINSVMHSEVFRESLSSSKVPGLMNEWIEEKTNGLIDKMIDEPFNPYTKLVLFNTVYFKAKWADPFEAYDVYTDKFYREDKEEIDTEIMHKESDMEYLSNDFAEGLIFPYRKDAESDGNFAFVALKSANEDMKVRELYEKLTPSVVSELIENKSTELVNTKLPKFELTFDKELNEGLINMGLNDAFDAEKADFSRIGAEHIEHSDENLYINLVRQKAKIIVDEEGTEAAAATAVMMECGAALIEELPKEVFFDRPFVYMIMDMDNEMPLFIGILDSPAACGKLP